MSNAIRVRVTDEATGELIGMEFVLDNDYTVLCAGNRYVADTKTASNTGTDVVTIRKRNPNNGGGPFAMAGPSGEGHGGHAK